MTTLMLSIVPFAAGTSTSIRNGRYIVESQTKIERPRHLSKHDLSCIGGHAIRHCLAIDIRPLFIAGRNVAVAITRRTPA
jgi:hypothetical protein